MHYHSKDWCQYEFYVNVFIFLYNFIFIGCIKLIKSNSIDIYKVTKISISNKCCSFKGVIGCKIHLFVV